MAPVLRFWCQVCKAKKKVHWFPQIMCRCSMPLERAVKEKISMFCHVEPTQVWNSFLFKIIIKTEPTSPAVVSLLSVVLTVHFLTKQMHD